MFEQIIENVIRRVVTGMLNSFSVKDLNYAVERNLDLLQLFRDNKPETFWWAQNIAKGYKQYANTITSEKVMEWVGDLRPDMVEFIKNNFQARDWLNKQITSFKNSLFGT